MDISIDLENVIDNFVGLARSSPLNNLYYLCFNKQGLYVGYFPSKEYSVEELAVKVENLSKIKGTKISKVVQYELFNALCEIVSQNDIIKRPAVAVKVFVSRLISGFTLKQLGEKIGKDYQHIQRWESGERVPKLENRQKIAEACGIDIKYLL